MKTTYKFTGKTQAQVHDAYCFFESVQSQLLAPNLRATGSWINTNEFNFK